MARPGVAHEIGNLTVPIEAEQVRRDLRRRQQAFLNKLRADLIFLGADEFLVKRMTVEQLLAARSTRVQSLMSAPAGARWDV